jgi:hypothetical protein
MKKQPKENAVKLMTIPTRTVLRWPFSRSSCILIALALFGLGLASVPNALGVVPAPDGGYPGGNTAEGRAALFSLTSGTYNTAVGWFSLRSNTEGKFNTGVGAATLLLNTGDENTATGAGALLNNTTAINNTANGAFSLILNTTGSDNTANGAEALFNNTSGFANTATGYQALFGNTTGDFNTANGNAALSSNTTGNSNTATGDSALYSNTEGNRNTAIGSEALVENTTGFENTAVGADALQSNMTGQDNTANGSEALFDNTTGFENSAFGGGALRSNTVGDDNTAVGTGALFSNTTGSSNTALGAGAGVAVTTANNVIAIGHSGADVDNSCYIGNIFGASVAPDAMLVGIDSTGKLGTVASSRRFKEEIQPMDKASDVLLSLKPVTFRYKNYKNSPLRFGLIAEEVAEINPDLVARDNNGEIYTVRYDQINAMLLNEFLKEHKRVQEQEATIAELRSTVSQQQASFQSKFAEQERQIQALASGLQKVSAQLEMSNPVPKVACLPAAVLRLRDEGGNNP